MVILCLVERDYGTLTHTDLAVFSKTVLASELGIQNFNSFIFQYAPLEACMAIKAKVLLWALETFPNEEHFAYFDADTCAYSRFEELETAIQHAEIIVTPHHLLADDSHPGQISEHLTLTLMCGIFNTGFIAVRRCENATRFLKWWHAKLEMFCYKDIRMGLYFEQRWVEIAPSFFDITVLRDSNYNVAHWNIESRRLAFDESSAAYFVQGRPLRFFHFSMADSGRDLLYFRRYLGHQDPLFEIRDRYIRAVRLFDGAGLSRHQWTYGSFHSGEVIAYETRQRYRNYFAERMIDDPFCESNSAIAAAHAERQRQS